MSQSLAVEMIVEKPFTEMYLKEKRRPIDKTETLFNYTRDVHGKIEKHPIGNSFAMGTAKSQDWTDWLNILLAAHQAVADVTPPVLSRIEALKVDVAGCQEAARPNEEATKLLDAASKSKEMREALAYALFGSALMGGQMMRENLGGRLPVAHLHWADRSAAMAELRKMRAKADLNIEAQDVFNRLYRIMDEILSK